MTSVFLLFHTHHLSDGEDDDKILGVYSSKALAEKKIEEKYRKLPGFCETDGEFIIDEYKIDQDGWEEGFTTIKPRENKIWKLYSVKTIYRSKAVGRPKATDKRYQKNLDMIEERIVLIRARSLDEAIKKGEIEAKKYASSPPHINPYGQKVIAKYIRSIAAFEPFEDFTENKEVYSSTQLIPSAWSNKTITDRMLGLEHKNERQLRTKFLNKEFSGTVKKKN